MPLAVWNTDISFATIRFSKGFSPLMLSLPLKPTFPSAVVLASTALSRAVLAALLVATLSSLSLFTAGFFAVRCNFMRHLTIMCCLLSEFFPLLFAVSARDSLSGPVSLVSWTIPCCVGACLGYLVAVSAFIKSILRCGNNGFGVLFLSGDKKSHCYQ